MFKVQSSAFIQDNWQIPARVPGGEGTGGRERERPDSVFTALEDQEPPLPLSHWSESAHVNFQGSQGNACSSLSVPDAIVVLLPTCHKLHTA